MPTIDELARAEVRQLRRAMTDGFDIDGGLERVRRNEPTAEQTTGRAPRRGWMAAVVAAAAAFAVVGVLTLNDDPAGVVEQPLETTTQTPQETPAAVTTTPVTAPATQPATSTPSTTAAGLVDLDTVVVEQTVTDVAPQRTVLYTASVGAGVDQLGIEDCQECDPAIPWSPVRLPDGRLIIADTVNHRWVLVSEGQPSVVPWAPDAMIITPPVVDDAGLVYAVMRQSIGTPNEFGELWVLDPQDLGTPVERHPSSPISNSPVLLTANGVTVDGGLIDGVHPTMQARPEVATKLTGLPPTIDVTWDNSSRTWNVGTRYTTSLLRVPAEMADGSILVQQSGNGEQIIARLVPNGTAARTAVPYPRSWNGTRWADDRGIVQLELVADHWEIAEYALPSPAAADYRSGGIDLVDGTVFGLSFGSPAVPEDVIANLRPSVGEVTWDAGWQPMPTDFACTGNDSFRTIWWGDLRMTFESGANGTRLTAWSVGDRNISGLAPLGTTPHTIGPPTGIATVQGIGIGTPASEVTAIFGDDVYFESVGSIQLVSTAGIATMLYLDDDERVDGIVNSRMDCLGGQEL